jgi:arginine utilization regulatory protein
MAGNSPSPVMLYGETGTGKELFAQAIHNFYYGKQGHYVDINCAAIPENLIEGLLFGTVRGAYTGAVDRAGLFEQANGGTIFLDEINSMPLHLQGKLLRVLQEKKLRRVGSLTTIDLNVKLISSLNQSPRELIESGMFRMDLFYRLGVIYIKLPALRDRLPDIEELGRHFLQKYNAQMGKSLRNIAPEVIDLFWQYPWPGNVRELEHVIESAVNFAGRDETCLKLEHCYFANILEQEAPSSPSPDPDLIPVLHSHSHKPVPAVPENLDLCAALTALEKKMILRALEQSNGNVAGAARRLGISRQLLGHKISRLQLRRRLADLKFKQM